MATTEQGLEELTARGFVVTLTVGPRSTALSWSSVDYGAWFLDCRPTTETHDEREIAEEMHMLVMAACREAEHVLAAAGAATERPWRA